MESKITANHIIGVITIPMVALGLVGNLLSFMGFSRKKFSRNSISIYCRALAISDSFILYDLVYYIFLYIYNIDLNIQSDFLCKIYYYINVGLSPISIWILVAFSLDKMLHVLDRARNVPIIKKRSFQLAVAISMGLFHAFLYMFIPILIKLVPSSESDTTNNSSLAATEATFLCGLQYMDNFLYIVFLYIFEAVVIPSGNYNGDHDVYHSETPIRVAE
jgi:hypothetical protein